MPETAAQKRPLHRNAAVFFMPRLPTRPAFRSFCRKVLNIYFQRFKIVLYCFIECHILSKTSNSEGFIMFEELKLNENVGAPQPDALAQIARKDDFLQQLQEFLAQHKGENWCVAAIDIEHFKLYTELYGSQQAHSLLLSLTALLLEHSKATGSPVGYLGSDDFVLCLPDDKEQQLAIISHLQTCVLNDHRQGRYLLSFFGCVPCGRASRCRRTNPVQLCTDRIGRPCPAVGGMHPLTPAMLNRLKKQRRC